VVVLKHRVIPCLLLKDGGLVKTTKFSNPVYVGDPINAIRIFNDKEVDELMVLDVEASRQGREPDYALIEQFAGECFMPLCYGGGVSTVEQAQRLFALGVEKVCIQTTALRDMGLIRQSERALQPRRPPGNAGRQTGSKCSRHAFSITTLAYRDRRCRPTRCGRDRAERRRPGWHDEGHGS
jgi:tRNA-dihydrouridine synthase